MCQREVSKENTNLLSLNITYMYSGLMSERTLVPFAVFVLGQETDKDKDKDKDLFIGPQEFVVGYSKAPEQPQSSAGPICHSHAMTRTGREPATICSAVYGARRATHYATGDDDAWHDGK